jgi:hypothetical protein
MSTLLNTFSWPRMAHTQKRIVLTLWMVLIIGMLVRSYLMPYRNSVYPIFANAAREWNASVDMYDVTLPRDGLDKFRYAPVVAAFFSVFAWLPDQVGGLLWRIVNGGIFFAGVIVFVRTVFPRRYRLDDASVALLAVLLIPQSLGSLNNSQPNALVIGCLLLAMAATLRERWWWAAIALAVPVLFKVYPAAVVLLLVLIYPVRLGVRTALCLQIGFLVPFAMRNPAYVAQLYASWILQVAKDNRHSLPLEGSYRDFHVLTRWVGWPMPEGNYLILQLAMAGLVAAVLLHGHWQGWPLAHGLRATLDLGCCWLMLFGPATENSTYIVLAPTLALAVWESWQPGQSVWKRWALAAMVSPFVAASVVMMFPIGRYLSFFLLPVGALLLFGERLVNLNRLKRIDLATVRLNRQLMQAA